ncbi:MAG: glutamate--tRNA ligase [Dehalococcoidia bacterium]|nr:glutamate--tRNA ligase [Dehalococcoidia bacterium]
MTTTVRVRYAPSPTGEPHVGNIRTALFNWLYARHTGGAFILRIEDTDQQRIVEGALEAIYDSLDWLGLAWDEGPRVGGPYGPYIQSERKAMGIYQEQADQLVREGHAYYCYCTQEELEQMRKEQQRRKEPPRYDRRCRPLTDAEHKVREGKPKVVRFKTPLAGDPITVHDIIRGDVAFDPATLDDFVLLKSDGFPTYHLACVVDDHAMHISHVLRAEEWLPSTPRHLLLYQALAWDPPLFGHMPMIFGPDRAKLSKRHGATSTLEYRDQGFLPEAMFNFLALLGWSLDDKTEIIPREDMVRYFSLERVGKSPAIFDRTKLEWMNGVYLRQLPQDKLVNQLAEALDSYIQKHQELVQVPPSPDYLRAVVPLVQERLKTLNPQEVWDLCSFFLVELPEYGEGLTPKGMAPEVTRAALQATLAILQALDSFDAATMEAALRPLAERLQLKTGQLFGAIRLAVTGRTAAPPLFDTLAVVGRERVLARLAGAITKLSDETRP